MHESIRTVHSTPEREAAILALLPLARTVARRIRRRVTLLHDDLVAAAYEGAVLAVDHFDATRGVPIEHYAAAIIRGKVLNAVRSWDPVPERERRLLRAVESGLAPADEAYKRAAYRATCLVPLSLDRALPDGCRIPLDWSNNPADVVVQREAQREQRAGLTRLRSYLPDREQLVITRVYEQRRSLALVARELKISPQRASQIHLTALARMRELAS